MEAGKADPVPNLAQGKTRDAVAKMAGVGHSNVEKVKHIKKHGTKEINQKMESGELSINKAYELTKEKTVPPSKPRNPMTGEPLTEKVCTTCGRLLLIEKFYLSQGRYSSSCAQCEQMKRREGISPTIRENIDAIQKASDYLTDTERVMEYSIEDVIETVSSEFDRLIRVIETEVKNHNDLIKNPLNKEAFIKSLVQGVGLIQSKINELARIV
jgi:transposase